MNSKKIWVLILLLICGRSYAQQAGMQADMEHVFTFTDENGRAFSNSDAGVEGNPFFINNWTYGSFKIGNGGAIYSWKLKLNLYTQEVHFLSTTNNEMSFPNGYIKDLVLMDSTQYPFANYHFQCGFPKIDKQDTNTLYRVISDGKIKFLECQKVNIVTEKNSLTGAVDKSFRRTTFHYLYIGRTMEEVKRDKEFMLDLFKDKRAAVESFMTAKKLSFKSTEDIRKITDYYNGLQ
jgi:hypothetical protein